MTTYLQTVKLISGSSSVILKDLELCPIAPPGVDCIEKEDGTIVEWSHWTKITFPNGDVKLFMRKPTLQECMNNYQTGTFYQIKNDGSITMSVRGETFFWSAAVPGVAEAGTPVDRFISCRICGSDCEGGDYEDWRFCSRGCMVDSMNEF